MQSQHVHMFNHDPWANNYDANVRNEADPIRAGYADVLAWTASQVAVTPQDTVVDLGSGTGNATLLLPPAQRIVCVDISQQMMAIARAKLAHLTSVEFIRADLLAFFDRPEAERVKFDALVSTYAVHHLTEAEKRSLFKLIWRDLRPGGRVAFGDLMFADETAQRRTEQVFADRGADDVVEAVREEFFWSVRAACAELVEIGYAVRAVRQFSELSWGLSLRKAREW